MWAKQDGAPSLYIGPWQEFALGRALKQQHSRRGAQRPRTPLHESTLSAASNGGSSYAGSSAPPPADGEDLSQFVQAFKEMANNLDEEGAKNLLVWSPLFLPTVEGLMRNHGNDAGTRGPRPRMKAHNPPEVKQPAPHPRAQAVAAEKLEHMNRLKAMYAAEQQQMQQEQMQIAAAAQPPLAAAQHVAPVVAPADADYATCLAGAAAAACRPLCASGAGSVAGRAFDDLAAVAPRMANHTLIRQRSPSAPVRGEKLVTPHTPAGDDWEDEVDDLLAWTTDLPNMME